MCKQIETKVLLGPSFIELMMVVNTSLYILSLAVYIQVEQGTCIGTDLSPISKANAVPGKKGYPLTQPLVFRPRNCNK